MLLLCSKLFLKTKCELNAVENILKLTFPNINCKVIVFKGLVVERCCWLVRGVCILKEMFCLNTMILKTFWTILPPSKGVTMFVLHLFACQSQLRAFFPSNRLLETNNCNLILFEFFFSNSPMGFASGNTV